MVEAVVFFCNNAKVPVPSPRTVKNRLGWEYLSAVIRDPSAVTTSKASPQNRSRKTMPQRLYCDCDTIIQCIKGKFNATDALFALAPIRLARGAAVPNRLIGHDRIRIGSRGTSVAHPVSRHGRKKAADDPSTCTPVTTPRSCKSRSSSSTSMGK
mmetsp:Transcript_44894/g.87910  ORF Transcript_44894/g.87910 Transcript_44894/m.87910 type:complete len:155 (-) Transcript_44894:178-642(-)